MADFQIFIVSLKEEIGFHLKRFVKCLYFNFHGIPNKWILYWRWNTAGYVDFSHCSRDVCLPWRQKYCFLDDRRFLQEANTLFELVIWTSFCRVVGPLATPKLMACPSSFTFFGCVKLWEIHRKRYLQVASEAPRGCCDWGGPSLFDLLVRLW